MRGKFITLEGCDGVGKTTQIRRLQRELNKAGVDFVFTREPGGTGHNFGRFIKRNGRLYRDFVIRCG